MLNNFFEKRKEEYSVYLKSEHWQELRRQKLEQAGYKCEGCGYSDESAFKSEIEPRRLEVHHKRYNSLGSENLFDLRVLCEECHEREHKGINEEKLYKYWARAGRGTRELPTTAELVLIFVIVLILLPILFVYFLLTGKWFWAIVLFILLKFLWGRRY